jgi:hypothetical protein
LSNKCPIWIRIWFSFGTWLSMKNKYWYNMKQNNMSVNNDVGHQYKTYKYWHEIPL